MRFATMGPSYARPAPPRRAVFFADTFAMPLTGVVTLQE